jgi:3-methyladenine DNA glycosylase AlkC
VSERSESALVTIKSAAELCNVTVSTMCRWIIRDKIKTVCLGGDSRANNRYARRFLLRSAIAQYGKDSQQ